jgi:serine-type D-Ala-D-Ala carboxypeptidase (penicillin-binding protein 5/6)
MKTTWIFAIFVWTSALSAGQLRVPVRAEAALLLNAETGAILYEKNGDQPRAPGSITKIATLWYILEKYGHRLDETVVVPKLALDFCTTRLKRAFPEKYPSYLHEEGSTKMNLKLGEKVPMRTLLHGLMMVSANDAANALALHLGGTIEQFMGDLNQFLREKGIKDTWFLNPHGLHGEKHLTTAKEIAQITAMAIRHPQFNTYFTAKTYEKAATNIQPPALIKQFNRMILPGRYFYPKAIGGKTGHHSKAGFTYVAVAKHGERTLIAVLLNNKEVNDRYIDTKALFEAAFNEKKQIRTLLTEQYDQFSLPLKGAKQPNLLAKLTADLKLQYYPSEEPKLKSSIQWVLPRFPIQAGQNVGDLVLQDEKGRIVLRRPIVAMNTVEPTFFKQGSSILGKLISSKRTLPLLTMMGAVSLASGGILWVLNKRKRPRKK